MYLHAHVGAMLYMVHCVKSRSSNISVSGSLSKESLFCQAWPGEEIDRGVECLGGGVPPSRIVE